MHDLIIVGGGVAGLRVGIEMAKKGLQCCILEKYDIGGRVSTFKKSIPGFGKVQWENGAGRICTSHKKVLALFKKYGLTFVRYSSNSYYDEKPNNFNDLIDVYLEPLTNLDPDILATHTLAQLSLDDTFYKKFPYYSEINVLRADIALNSFHNEMGSSSFGVCKEGLSSLIDAMKKEFVSFGGKIMTGVEVLRVHKNTVYCEKKEFHAKNIVLALHSNALKRIKGIHAPVLKHLRMEPLLRIYAVFKTPVNIPRIITASPIRNIIPISPHIVMISYTDGADTKFWRKKEQDAVMKELRKIVDVPDPIFFKKHYWADGCTYWLPGKYDVEEESAKSLQIADNVFVCGESFAVNQCWIESALDQADKLLAFDGFLLKHL
jgi:phytoene dehydrogenase-like protein